MFSALASAGALAPLSSPVSGDANEGAIGSIPAAAITAGTSHTCAILDGGVVKCWGSGGSGRLGQGNTNTFGDGPNEMGNNLPAIDLGTGRTATAIASSTVHTCALLDNGSVKCWGSGGLGRLGQGNTNILGDGPNEMGDNLHAVDLGTGRTATAIAAGESHTCALLDNGSVKCWGDGFLGRLGQGNVDNLGDGPNEMGDNLQAVKLGTGRTARAVAAGGGHTCVLLDNGSVKCWGDGGSGRLGQGNTNPIGDGTGEMGDDLPAIDLGTGRTATAIATGFSATCALLDTGDVKCWGQGSNGVLGQGNTNPIGDGTSEMGDDLPAIDLGTGRTATAITVGAGHACALLDNATIKCWGAGGGGPLGQGDPDNRGDATGEMGDDLPAIDLGTGRTVVGITTGASHTCALLDNGTLKCWGGNTVGQLGQGTTSDLGDAVGEMGDSLPAISLNGLIGRSVVTVTLSADKSSVVAGRPITYTVSVRNKGTVPLTGVVVSTGDTPCSRSFVSIATQTTKTYTCSYRTVAGDVPQMSNQVFVTTAQGRSAQSARVRTRVDAAVVRPDSLIRVGTNGAFAGDNSYNSTGAEQTVTRNAAKGTKVVYTWRIQNDGNTARTFTLEGTQGTARFAVVYQKGSADITNAVVAGTFNTPTLAPGASTTVSATVTPTKKAAVGNTLTLVLTAKANAIADTVKTTTRRT